jgi:hypothetical protein
VNGGYCVERASCNPLVLGSPLQASTTHSLVGLQWIPSGGHSTEEKPKLCVCAKKAVFIEATNSQTPRY